MKYKLMFITILIAVIYSCSKEMNVPISSFSIKGDTISTLKVGTLDEFWVASNSKNSNSILWDFGDGRTSKEAEYILSYPKSGTYTIKLIARNNNGELSESSKKIIVLDRVLKKIVIDYVQWDSTNLTEPWPRCYNVDLYFQMQFFADNSSDSNGFYYDCPILYTSPLVKNIHNHYMPTLNPPIEIPVSEKVIIEKNLIQFAPNNLNNSYLFSIMAKDSEDNNYRLVNNAFAGYTFGITKDDIELNTFVVEMFGSTTFKLICNFE